MNPINMKNAGLCFAHFKRVCSEDTDCPADNTTTPPTARISFSDMIEGGTPMCSECTDAYELVGVEIISPKPSRLRVRHGSESLPKKDRPVGSYKFTTDADRDEALKLLEDFNGFLDYEILYPK
jgi:hypothetical protein